MPERRPSIAAERIRLVYRQAPYVLAVNPAVATLATAALWSTEERGILLAWLCAIYLLAITRTLIYIVYRRASPKDERMAWWGRVYTLGALMSGILWGSTALLFILPGDPLTLGLVAFVIAGMAAGALTAMSAHLPAFFAYLLASVAPLAWVLLGGDAIHKLMAGMAVTFVLGLGFIARSNNAALTERLTLMEQNRRLLDVETAERRRAEEEERRLAAEMARQANQCDAILSATDDHVFMICWSGALLYVSPSVRRTFALGGGKPLRSWSDLGFSPEEQSVLQRLHAGIMATGETQSAEVTHQTATGLRRFEYKFSPFRERDGPISAVIAVARDVTDRRRAEDALKEARAEAEEANQAKTRFLAAASHDLRQPMQSMFLFASVLRQRIADPKALEPLKMLESGLKMLKGQLDTLIDVSRLDLDVIQPQVTVFALRPFLEEIAAAFTPIAQIKGLELRIDVSPGVMVRSDPNLLGRMVNNLLENAVRYTERGHVCLRDRRVGDHIRIEVEDTGIGIPADQLSRIFEEFHQIAKGAGRRGASPGTGLGLAIVQRLSRALDHPVDVQSEPRRGSLFAITVPAAAE